MAALSFSPQKAVLLITGVAALAWLAYGWRMQESAPGQSPTLRQGLDPDRRLSFHMQVWDFSKAISAYSELTGLELVPNRLGPAQRLDRWLGGRLTRWRIISAAPIYDSGIRFHGDGLFRAGELKEDLEHGFRTNHLQVVAVARDYWKLVRATPSGGR
jgi:hypothetical protein